MRNNSDIWIFLYFNMLLLVDDKQCNDGKYIAMVRLKHELIVYMGNIRKLQDHIKYESCKLAELTSLTATADLEQIDFLPMD